MRFRLALTTAVAAGLLAVGGAVGQPQPVRGYLAQTPDPATILRPAPKDGDPRDLEDRRVFEATRKLEGGPRWSMAQADLPYTVQSRISTFSCAVGVRLDPTTAPKLTAIFSRTIVDLGRMNAAAKGVWSRPRPYRRWGGTICSPPSPALDASFDYPSGHAQIGWMDAQIMAAVVPDRAAEVLARGRAFAESRVVCGVHTLSAIDAGMTLASAQFARSVAEPEFLADLEAARAEIAALRAAAQTPAPAACSAEAALNKSLF